MTDLMKILSVWSIFEELDVTKENSSEIYVALNDDCAEEKYDLKNGFNIKFDLDYKAVNFGDMFSSQYVDRKILDLINKTFEVLGW